MSAPAGYAEQRAARELSERLAAEARSYRLRPGFPRTWPACQQAMRVIIRHLWALGATDEELLACMRRDFPGLPVPTRPDGTPCAPWREDAYYNNPIQIEKQRLNRHPELRQRPDEPDGTLDPARLQAAELVLDELAAHGAGARRKGEGVQVFRLDPGTTHRLPDDLKEAAREYGEEVWELIGEAPPPALPAPSMGRRLLAFAAVRGYRCASCGREGGESGDPDGAAWREARDPGGGYALSCSACLARPGRIVRSHAEV